MSGSSVVLDSPVAPRRSNDAEGEFGVRLRRYEARTGLPFAVIDGTDGEVCETGDLDCVPYLPARVLDELARIRDCGVVVSPDVLHYAIRLKSSRPVPYFAVGYVLRRPGVRPEEIVARGLEEGWSAERLDAWFADRPVCSRELLERLLVSLLEREAATVAQEQLHEEVESLGLQIQQTYEEISLLHTLTRNLHISRTPSDVAEMCLDRVHWLVGAAGIAIWLEEGDQAHRFLVKGELPLDEIGIAQLVARFDEHDWRRPLVRNHIDRTLLGISEPDLDNIVVVAIAEGDHRYGWIVACNLPDDREFGTAEASLLGSVGTILGTHTRNIELYNQHEQLLVSLVQSFVSTLDAKDPYTRGHSERVALIARRIAEEMGLAPHELEDVHLAGVLHDVGKIGVDDRILRKPDRLTDEEFDQIKQHPTIGYNILLGVKHLRKILPGVRNHHENWDGTGYPDQLGGDAIPLMARVLAVADAYDAMGSDRPYRQGMPLEKIESIFRNGADVQWDARIVDAYFRARDDIRAICLRYSFEDGTNVRV